MPFSAGDCGIEYEIEYMGMQKATGKDPKYEVKDVAGCKSYCHSDGYFTWDSRYQECNCKTSNSEKMHRNDGVFSGRANCQGKFDRGLRFGLAYW